MNGSSGEGEAVGVTGSWQGTGEDSGMNDVRRFVAPLSKEQLIDLVATAAINHKDIYVKCTEAVASSPAARRLMIRNIPFSTRDDTFLELFRQFGEIDDGLVVREKDGRSRGYGFVTYKFLDSVQRCLASRHTLEEKELFVKLAADPFTDTDQRKLFVRNLSDTTGSESLRAVFQQFGSLEECVVVADNQGKSRGYGFVTFCDCAEAFKAVQQTQRLIDGRVVFVDFASPPNTRQRSSDVGRRGRFGREGARDQAGGRGRGHVASFRGGGMADFQRSLGGNNVNGPYGYAYAYGPGMYPAMPQSFGMGYPGNMAPHTEYYQNAPGGRY